MAATAQTLATWPGIRTECTSLPEVKIKVLPRHVQGAVFWNETKMFFAY